MQSLFANPTYLHQPRPHPKLDTPIAYEILIMGLPYTFHTGAINDSPLKQVSFGWHGIFVGMSNLVFDFIWRA